MTPSVASACPWISPCRSETPLGGSAKRKDPPRVVVSGWRYHDNKGRVVAQYEPFCSHGFEYAPPEDAQFGQKVSTYYDPRGQVIRTVNPDGSEQRVVFGVPVDLSPGPVYSDPLGNLFLRRQ
jgi:YD repeat-containing protein